MKILIYIIFICGLYNLGFSYCQGVNYHNLTNRETELLDTLQYRTFLYFVNESNRENGLVKDRSTKDSPASIAAVGFALPAYAVGAEHGWITRKEAAERTLNTLNFFLNSRQSADAVSTGFHGLYYHFLNMNSGMRYWNCELSTIDSGLLFAGIIFARQYFNKNSKIEKEIREKSTSILERADWNYFSLPGKSKFPYDITMAWMPGEGISSDGWKGYNEAMIMFIIAAGSGMKNAAEGYNTWTKTFEWQKPYPGLEHLVFPPLFGHQFTAMFINLKGTADDYMRSKGIDYFENSKRATETQRQYCIENPLGWKGYDSLVWGISACDGPGESYNFDDKKFIGYAGRGTSGPKYNYYDDGTIAPYASAASIVFSPDIVIPTLMNFYNQYKAKGIWGKYGFVDSFNLTAGWYDKDYLGIDEGPTVLMLENFRSGLLWKYMMRDPIIKKGMKILGFINLNN